MSDNAPVAPAAPAAAPAPLARPSPADAAASQAATDAATAQASAERSALMNDKAFRDRFLSGDKDALNQIQAIIDKGNQPASKAADGGAPKPAEPKTADGTTPNAAEAASDAMPPTPYDLGLPADTPAAKAMDSQGKTHAIVTALGYTQDMARGAVNMIAKAQAARGGRELDALETNHLEHLLHTRFGDQYDARMDAVTANLKKLGSVRGAQMQHVMRSVDPLTSCWLFETLSRGAA